MNNIVSLLKETRYKKRYMLNSMVISIITLIGYPIGRMDKVDFRILKKLSIKLNELVEKAKPI